MIYALDYEKLQHDTEDPFKDYTDKFIHKTGKNWFCECNNTKTNDLREVIDEDYDYIIFDHFSDNKYFAVPCFKLSVDGKDYIAMCDIDTVFDDVPVDFSFERDISKVVKTYNQNRNPAQLRAHKNTPKQKRGIRQLENSVRRMF